MGCEAGVPLSPVHVRPKLKVVVPKYCARIARVQKGCCQTIVGGGLRDRGSVITRFMRGLSSRFLYLGTVPVLLIASAQGRFRRDVCSGC